MSWDSIHDNWKLGGSVLTLLSTLSLGLRKIGGPRKFVRAVRSQWHLNLLILDLEDRLDRANAQTERAKQAEREANERTKEADQRTEDMAAMTQTLLSAVSVVQEARDKGLLRTLPPSLLPDTPPPATSTTSPPKPTGPLDILDR